MAVRIRMKRLGRKHRPFYRVCVMDAREKRDGKAIEEVGHYDPMVADKAARVKLDLERIDYWVGVGAKPTHKVGVLIKKLRKNDFGTAKAAPAMQAPKEPEKPPEEAAPEETPAEDAAAEASTETPAEGAAAE